MNIAQKIYIFCPAGYASGGPEALHQLRFYMEAVKLNAYLVYYGNSKNNLTPDRYLIYNPKIKTIDEIIDIETNYIIVPENNTLLLNDFFKIRKCIWWLSVGFYDNPPMNFSEKIKNEIKYILGYKQKEKSKYNFNLHDCLNLCGSLYAFNYLTKLGVKNQKFLIEPISKEFLECKKKNDFERDEVILYNPSKTSVIMKKLLERKEFVFLPLQGYNIDQLIDIYSKAKLYIDFGDFNGPERIPKEAVYFGCSILVGKKNAAKNSFDVAIPNKYKIKNYNNVDLVSRKIRDMLFNYEKNIKEFDEFKIKISKLEVNFINQISEIFC